MSEESKPEGATLQGDTFSFANIKNVVNSVS